MTTINIVAKKTGLVAPQLLGAARFTAQAFNAVGPYILIEDDVVVFPAQITVEMINGIPETAIDLPPTDGTFFYKVSVESYDKPYSLTRNVAVPALGPVDFESLVDVDPQTFLPSPSNVSAWEAAVGAVQALVTDVESLALQAQVSSLQAADSLTGAQTAVSQVTQLKSDTESTVITGLGTLAQAVIAAQDAKTGAEQARDESQTVRVDLGDIGGPITIPTADSRSKYLIGRLTSNLEVALEPGIAGLAYTCTLKLQQDAQGSRALRLVNVATAEGLPILLSTVANATDLIRLEWDGTTWTAFLSARNLSIPTSWVV